MNYFKFKKIIYRARKIALTDDERNSMRADFVSKIGLEEEKSNLFDHFVIADLKKPKVLALVTACCFMALALPVVYASEKSLPGDVFYPIKTKINEPIKKAVNNIVSNNNEDYEIKLLEERFEEAKELIKKEKLDDERSEKVRESINKQIGKFEKENTQNVSEKVYDEVDKELNKLEEKIEKGIEKTSKEDIDLDKEIGKKIKDTEDEVKSKKDKVKEVLENNTDVLDKIKLKI